MKGTAESLPTKEEFGKLLETVLNISERPIDFVVINSIGVLVSMKFIFKKDVKTLHAAIKKEGLEDDIILATPLINSLNGVLSRSLDELQLPEVVSTMKESKSDKSKELAKQITRKLLYSFYAQYSSIDAADNIALRGGTGLLRVSAALLKTYSEDDDFVKNLGLQGVHSFLALFSALSIGMDYDLKKMPLATFSPLIRETFGAEAYEFFSTLLGQQQEDKE